jgi:hypothetical protein
MARSLFRPKTNHTCRQKPNLSHEKVSLKYTELLENRRRAIGISTVMNSNELIELYSNISYAGCF